MKYRFLEVLLCLVQLTKPAIGNTKGGKLIREAGLPSSTTVQVRTFDDPNQSMLD